MIRNQQYLYPKFPPTVVVKLLQYSGSKVKHRDGFSSYNDLSEVKNGEFSLDFKVFGKNRGVGDLQIKNKISKEIF